MSDVKDVAPDGIMGAAITTVIDRLQQLDNVAEKYRLELSKSLSGIATVEVAQVEPPQRIPAPNVPIPQMDFSTRPVFNQVAFNIPQQPSFTNIDALLTDLDLSDLEIPPMPEMPAVQLPDMPGINFVAPPEKPVIDTDIIIPEAPVLVMPELAELIQLDIPKFEFQELPDFEGVPPSLGEITVPNVFMNWAEPEYKSELLDELSAKIKTGIPKCR